MKLLIFTLTLIVSLFSANAQRDLRVECYATPSYPENVYNAFFLDNIMQEYGICAFSSFTVGIMDDTCGVWDTSRDLGNYNSFGVCLPRFMRYFVYRQNNLNELKSLDSVLNNVIPTGYPFIIYTPAFFDYSMVSTLYPPLGQTLINYWGNAVVDARMMVSFGIKGYPESYALILLS